MEIDAVQADMSSVSEGINKSSDSTKQCDNQHVYEAAYSADAAVAAVVGSSAAMLSDVGYEHASSSSTAQTDQQQQQVHSCSSNNSSSSGGDSQLSTTQTATDSRRVTLAAGSHVSRHVSSQYDVSSAASRAMLLPPYPVNFTPGQWQALSKRMKSIAVAASQSVSVGSSQQQQQQQQQGLNLNKLSLKLHIGLHTLRAMLCTVEGQEYEACNLYSVLSLEQLRELSDYIAANGVAPSQPQQQQEQQQQPLQQQQHKTKRKRMMSISTTSVVPESTAGSDVTQPASTSASYNAAQWCDVMTDILSLLHDLPDEHQQQQQQQQQQHEQEHLDLCTLADRLSMPHSAASELFAAHSGICLQDVDMQRTLPRERLLAFAAHILCRARQATATAAAAVVAAANATATSTANATAAAAVSTDVAADAAESGRQDEDSHRAAQMHILQQQQVLHQQAQQLRQLKHSQQQQQQHPQWYDDTAAPTTTDCDDGKVALVAVWQLPPGALGVGNTANLASYLTYFTDAMIGDYQIHDWHVTIGPASKSALVAFPT
eukprot:16809-Heterococcus_DN1.PRE.1